MQFDLAAERLSKPFKCLPGGLRRLLPAG